MRIGQDDYVYTGECLEADELDAIELLGATHGAPAASREFRAACRRRELTGKMHRVGAKIYKERRTA
jgi:hypothetical protein